MKTLILFSFLASMAWGQTDTIKIGKSGNHSINTKSNTIKFVETVRAMTYSFSSDTTNPVNVSGVLYKNKIGVYQTMVIATLLQQYEAYAKECWADSSVSSVSMEYDSLATVKYYERHPSDKKWGLIMKETKTYSHPEPTFTGFIEFLKRGVK